MTKWTDEQRLAIDENNKRIIVSAGAGSGKTAVLSERVIEKLKKGINIDNLLILTFTNAAANEMKIRIRDKIKDEIKVNPNLKEQLSRIDSAYITTFDAYSLALVKKYNYLLNVNKDVGIVDSAIINLKKRKIIDKIFDEMYEKEDELFLNFI